MVAEGPRPWEGHCGGAEGLCWSGGAGLAKKLASLRPRRRKNKRPGREPAGPAGVSGSRKRCMSRY